MALGDKVFDVHEHVAIAAFMAAKRDAGFRVIKRDKFRRVNGRGFTVTTVFWYAK